VQEGKNTPGKIHDVYSMSQTGKMSLIGKKNSNKYQKSRNHSKRSNLSERIGTLNNFKSRGYPFSKNKNSSKRKIKLSFPEENSLVFGGRIQDKRRKSKNFKS
jgi:hypothetical protein